MVKYIKNNLLTLSLICILLLGLCLLLYPSLSDYWNSFHQSKAIAGYVQRVDDLTNKKNEKLYKNAVKYNEKLKKNGILNLNLSSKEISVYNHTLDITHTGMMAYVDIPKINTTLPIYHGTDNSVLQVAIGHIPGTSLPIGGKGTHSVISGHRGLPSAKLFTNIDNLVEGDIFMIRVLDKTLTYQVDKILTVKPDDVSALSIQPNKDYVTLVTCTPYGVNTHRLLVRGHRIINRADDVYVISEASSINPLLVSVIISMLVLLLILMIFTIKNKIYQ